MHIAYKVFLQMVYEIMCARRIVDMLQHKKLCQSLRCGYKVKDFVYPYCHRVAHECWKMCPIANRLAYRWL